MPQVVQSSLPLAERPQTFLTADVSTRYVDVMGPSYRSALVLSKSKYLHEKECLEIKRP